MHRFGGRRQALICQSVPRSTLLLSDDFTGRLANNTNLAAKGVVALQAYAELCRRVGESNCDQYDTWAEYFVGVWMHYAREEQPAPHYKIAYNYTNSWGLKYNIVWQRILHLQHGAFPDEVFDDEVAFYIRNANAYGTPLDVRHDYVV